MYNNIKNGNEALKMKMLKLVLGEKRKENVNEKLDNTVAKGRG